MEEVFGVPIADVNELEPGFTPVEAVVMLKGIDMEGNIGLVMLTSDGLTAWEILGMAEMLRDDVKNSVHLTYTGDEEDDA